MQDVISSKNTKTWSVGTLSYTASGIAILFFWLLWGDFAWAMKDRAIAPAATLLIRSFDVSNLLYSLIIISFPNFTNIFLCPIISYISDRHRSKWGRRVPFLFFTTPFIVIGSIGLGFSPAIGRFLSSLAPESITPNLGGLLGFSFFWILLDFGTTLSGALSGALINDVVPQALLGRFYALFRAISLLAGMIFTFFILGLVEEYFMWIFAGVGVLYGIGLYSLCFKIKEGEYPPVEKVVQIDNKLSPAFMPIASYFKQCFSNPYYRWVIFMLVFGQLSAAPFNMFAIFYAKSLNLDMNRYGLMLAITYCVSFGISYFLGVLADKYHPLRVSLVAQVIYFIIMVGGWIVIANPSTFAYVLLGHGLISGCYFTLSASLALRLFPRALFAQFNSAFAMISAIFFMLTGPALGLMLDILNRNYRYVFIFGAVVTFLSLIGFIKVLFYYNKLGGDKSYTPPQVN